MWRVGEWVDTIDYFKPCKIDRCKIDRCKIDRCKIDRYLYTAPQPVLVIMSLNKGNVIGIKKSAAHAITLYNEPPDKGDIIPRLVVW